MILLATSKWRRKILHTLTLLWTGDSTAGPNTRKMHNTKVQLGGDIGVLTFNLVNYNENDSVTTKWNSTETYRLEQGQWMLLHSHWSYTKPNQE